MNDFGINPAADVQDDCVRLVLARDDCRDVFILRTQEIARATGLDVTPDLLNALSPFVAADVLIRADEAARVAAPDCANGRKVLAFPAAANV